MLKEFKKLKVAIATQKACATSYNVAAIATYSQAHVRTTDTRFFSEFLQDHAAEAITACGQTNVSFVANNIKRTIAEFHLTSDYTKEV